MPTALPKAQGRSPDSAAPALDYVAVTLDTDFYALSAGIYVGTAGNLSVQNNSGQTVVFNNVAAGIIHPICARRVTAAGTTASNLIAVF